MIRRDQPVLTQAPHRVLAPVSLALALTSCGHPSPQGVASEANQVHITNRAVAAVAAEHLGTPERAGAEERDWFKRTIATATLRYSQPSEDGDPVTIEVGKGLSDPRIAECGTFLPGGCFDVNGVRVHWDTGFDDEEPGSVAVLAPRPHGVYLGVVYSAPEITGDPRHLDLRLPLDDLVALARDARIDRTTHQATVTAGENLDFWTFG